MPRGTRRGRAAARNGRGGRMSHLPRGVPGLTPVPQRVRFHSGGRHGLVGILAAALTFGMIASAPAQAPPQPSPPTAAKPAPKPAPRKPAAAFPPPPAPPAAQLP